MLHEKKGTKMKALSTSFIGLALLAFSCSNANQTSMANDQSQVKKSGGNTTNSDIIPTDDYYQKGEKDYSYFKAKHGDSLKSRLDKIPTESNNSIKTAKQLKECFEIKLPDLPGVPGTLTRHGILAGPHGIYAGYRTRIREQILSGTQVDIRIYQNYEQARRFAVLHWLTLSQPAGVSPDEEKKMGDYSWNVKQPLNGDSFNINILHSNLYILIGYSEWIESPSGSKYSPIDDPKRKEQISQAILKFIQDCQ